MTILVIDTQWGNEGVPSVVDALRDSADVVVVFSVGFGTRRAVTLDGSTHKLRLLPAVTSGMTGTTERAGAVIERQTIVFGSTMAVDLEELFDEIEKAQSSDDGYVSKIVVSDRAHVILPQYKARDLAPQTASADVTESTDRGMSMAYALKAVGEGVRVRDLFAGDLPADLADEDREQLIGAKQLLSEMAVDVAEFMRHSQRGNTIIQGAQGALLDPDLGPYPFVSSGPSAAGGAAATCGIGPRGLDRIIGVCKAYSTTAGEGPFPTELPAAREGELADRIRRLELPSTREADRGMRCGYLDLVALRYSCFANSVDCLALINLDIYDGDDVVKVCIAYENDSESTVTFPSSPAALRGYRPVTKGFAGWKTPTHEVEAFSDLPAEARELISFIEDFVDKPVDIVSVGRDTNQIIIRRNPWIGY